MANSKMGEWAAAVKKRDGKCLDCGRVEDLHAHHIKPKSSHPELALDPENGRTLCYRCHKAEHERNRSPRGRGGKPQRRTLERQIEELMDEVRTLKQLNKALKQVVDQHDRMVEMWKTPKVVIGFIKPTREEVVIAKREMAEWRARHASEKQRAGIAREVVRG